MSLRNNTTRRVVYGPASSGPNPKTNLNPKSCPPKKVKVGLKNSMLLSYFDYIFVHLSQKARLWLK